MKKITEEEFKIIEIEIRQLRKKRVDPLFIEMSKLMIGERATIERDEYKKKSPFKIAVWNNQNGKKGYFKELGMKFIVKILPYEKGWLVERTA